TVYVYSRVK
nr:Chain A, THR-VAL-TYR-VAL-TYR-SER-ARG-VAL-LYS [Severe acute respiratory syndrome-related coronavirus]5XES_A Chain A, THR-VAL-TYR-VAL-TYR-SER-ARG-VAL-LYS [Severe acute respiratory syndrome-related coronavirus]